MTLWRFSTLRADDQDSGRLRPKPLRRARGGEFTKEDKGFERVEDCPVSERKRESKRFPTKRVVPVSKACDKSVKSSIGKCLWGLAICQHC